MRRCPLLSIVTTLSILVGACYESSELESCETQADCAASQSCLNGTCRVSSKVDERDRSGRNDDGGWGIVPPADTNDMSSDDTSQRDSPDPPDAPSPPSSPDPLSCYQIQTCGWLYCKNERGNDCKSDLLEQGEDREVGKFQQFQACTRRNGCQEGVVTRCARRQCSNELDTCLSLDADPPFSCSEIVQCLYTCDANDTDCRQRCLEEASSQARTRYKAFSRCSGQKCQAPLNSEKGRRCLKSKCLDVFKSCFHCRASE